MYHTEVTGGTKYEGKGANIDPKTGLYKSHEYKPSEDFGKMGAKNHTTFRTYDPKSVKVYTNKDIKEYTNKDIKPYEHVRTNNVYREYVMPKEERKLPKVVPKKKEQKPAETQKPKTPPKQTAAKPSAPVHQFGSTVGTVKRSLWLSS